jgi:hypothetical protein
MVRDHLARVIALLAAFVLASLAVLLADAPLWSKLGAAVLALIGLSLIGLWLPLPWADWRARRWLRVVLTAVPLAAAGVVIGLGLTIWRPGPSQIPSQPATLLLLDASETMTEPLAGGGSKFEVAMEELEEERRVPENSQLGLASFGIEGCDLEADPVNEIVTIAPGGAERIREEAGQLVPGGEANLVTAARFGVGLLGPFTGPRNVVVITGGLDTCGGDLGELLSVSRVNGVPIRWELVGLGLTPDEKQRAEQFPGITVHLADTAVQLEEVLESLLFEQPIRNDLELLRKYVEEDVAGSLNAAIRSVNLDPADPDEADKQLRALRRLATEGEDQFAEFGTSEGACDFAPVEDLLRQQFGYLTEAADALAELVAFDRGHPGAPGGENVSERDALVDVVEEPIGRYNANFDEIPELVEDGLNECFGAA